MGENVGEGEGEDSQGNWKYMLRIHMRRKVTSVDSSLRHQKAIKLFKDKRQDALEGCVAGLEDAGHPLSGHWR